MPESVATSKSSSNHNLPLQLTSFIGREAEIREIQTLLTHSRLVTLTGVGGVGKTRLSLELAHSLLTNFEQIFFVSLASINNPSLLIPTMAQALGLKENPSQSFSQQIKATFQRSETVLVLDNFEQVLEAGLQVAELLEACPLLKVIVTSRASLRLSWEQEYPIEPLSAPGKNPDLELEAAAKVAAVKLFVQRARAVKPNFSLSPTNVAAIAEICTRLDGLPLAIELATPWLKLLSPQQLLERLDDPLKVLVGGSSDLPLRQQTIFNTIEWSYNLLNPAEQQLFRELCIFAGGCSLEAVGQICTDQQADILIRLRSLVDKNLLKQPEASESGQNEPRLVLLETIREFGLAKLKETGEEEAVRVKHLNYYLKFSGVAFEKHKGREQRVWENRLQQEQPNLRAAMAWAIQNLPEAALEIAGNLVGFWNRYSYYQEGNAWLKQTLKAIENTESPSNHLLRLKAVALFGIGVLSQPLSDYSGAKQAYQEALELARTAGDESLIGGILCSFAVNFKSDRSKALAEEGLNIARKQGKRWELAQALLYYGHTAMYYGDYVKAQQALEENLAIRLELGDTARMVDTLWRLGHLYTHLDELERARAIFEEYLKLTRESDDNWGIAVALGSLGWVLALKGEHQTAKAMLNESIALKEQWGDKAGIAYSLRDLADIAIEEKNYSEAYVLIEKGIYYGYDTEVYNALLLSLASLALVVGQTASGVRVLGACEGVLTPFQQRKLDLAVAKAKAELGDEAFSKLLEEGRMMKREKFVIADFLEPPSSFEIVTLEDRTELSSPNPVSALPTAERLTRRELMVLKLMASGLTNAQLAEQLNLSILTVTTHLKSIYAKLGVNSRTTAIHRATELNILQPHL